MATVATSTDLAELLNQLPDTPMPAVPPGFDTSTAPPVSAESPWMRLRQFLTGAVTGAGGGARGARMPPAMLLSNLALEATGRQPVTAPTPEEIATKALDY